MDLGKRRVKPDGFNPLCFYERATGLNDAAVLTILIKAKIGNTKRSILKRQDEQP